MFGEFDIRINKTSKGGYADYSTSKWSRRESALTETQNNAINTNGLYNLNDFLPKKPSEVELKVMKEMFEASVNGESYDAEKFGSYYFDNVQYLKIKTESGVNLYQVGGSVPKLRFYTGFSEESVAQQLSIEESRFVLSGAPTGTVITERIDVSGDIYQSGVLIDTGTFALKADTGSFITSIEGTSTSLAETGQNLSGYIDAVSGNIMNTGANLSGWIADISGKTVYKTETGVFPTGTGVVGYIAKWTDEINGSGRVLHTG